ncbi:MAG: hypothetical protein KAJ01_06610, partial [Candidatus Hydrogenedentes bacterium]|nr:hypothetical protein [Candidatus Hydrogenedentota bacterium]
MDSDYPDHEQVRLSDIVKRGIAISDANIIFIILFFIVNFLTWFAFDHIRTHLIGSDTPAETERLRLIILYLFAVSVPISALIDSLIGALLRKQLLPTQPDSNVSLLAWGRKFYFRMLLLTVIQGVAFVLAFPLDSAFYIPLRYAAAFVIWQDCSVRKAFAGTNSFLAPHSAKFLPVWLVGTAVLVWANLTAFLPASSNPVFTGLVHLVLAYFDFAMMATALVFFLML